MCAYYPVVLTGASLIVCFWAEVFHLQEIRWDRPRFLSKSFLGFVAFNIISYSLLIAELLLIWFGQEHLHFYTHIFNGCYAVLMFIGKILIRCNTGCWGRKKVMTQYITCISQKSCPIFRFHQFRLFLCSSFFFFVNPQKSGI